MIDEIKNVINFLESNEYFGDDWKKEIAVLEKLLNKESDKHRKIIAQGVRVAKRKETPK